MRAEPDRAVLPPAAVDRAMVAATLLATALLATAICGCQTAWHGNAAQDPTSEAAPAADPQKTPPAAPAADQAQAAPKTPNAPNDPHATATPISASAAAGAAALADDRWVQAVATPTDAGLANSAPLSTVPPNTVPPNTVPPNTVPPNTVPLGTAPTDTAPTAAAPTETAAAKYRWRHFGLEAWLARGTWRPELAAALGDSQRVVATNAAIVLARDTAADTRVVPALVAAIDDVNLRLPLRFAAIEALACIPTAAAQNELARLADQQVQFLRTTPSAYIPQMHTELLLGLTRSRGPGEREQDNPRFAAGLVSTAPEVRRVSLCAWLEPDRKELPPLVIELRRDPDPRVRATALAVLAVQRPKPAETLLLAALDDTDLSVRIAAIGALGKLGTPAARAALEKLRTHSHEAARVESVHALYKLAGYQAVVASAHDKAWRVRQAVAESLSQAGDDPSSENIELARSLVRDPSLDVQRQMIKSLATWPIEEAGPVMLAAMSDAGYQTRKDAAAQLVPRWPAAAEFPVEALAPERAASIATLSARWKNEFSAASNGQAQQADPGPATAHLSPKDLARLRSLVDAVGNTRILPAARQTALDTLVAYGTALPAALESPEFADQGSLPEVVYEEVLPKVSPVFAALDGLGSGDLRLRRGGGTQLVTSLGGKPMPLLALDRLVVLARRENDPVVWQCLLQATAADGRAGAVQLAYLAVGNASSDVRRRACDYLAAHPDVRHTAVLMPMLEDSSSTVVVAAVRGLGATGVIDDPRPLVGLLMKPDRELRLEVATTLVRLKIEDGRAALQRMAFEPDMQLRLEVAQRLGTLGEPVFTPTLIQMSAEANDVGRVALESLTKMTGQDFSRDADGAIVPRDAQTSQWQAWYRRQQLAGEPPATPAETASATSKD
jgi:HEAT repeat protein